MAKAKKNEKKTAPAGARAAQAAVAARGHRRLSRLEILLMLVAAITVVAVVLVLLVSEGVFSIGGRTHIDFIDGELSRYVTLPDGAWRDYTVTVSVAPIRDMDVEDAILQARADQAPAAAEGGGAYYLSRPIDAGDVVYIWYRGYTLDENGRKVDFSGGTNLWDDEPSKVTVGSGSMIPGFELGLVGVVPEQTLPGSAYSGGVIDKLRSGRVQDGDVIYVTYSAIPTVGAMINNQQARIDLSDPQLEQTWGEGFLDMVKEYEIGYTKNPNQDLTIPNTTDKIFYQSIRIDFATRGLDDYATVEARFPDEYSETSLQGKTAYFDVYVEKMQDYATPALTDEFVEQTLKLDVSSYEGTDTLSRYHSYVRSTLEQERQQTILERAKEGVLQHLGSLATVKLPEREVTYLYNDVVAQLTSMYQSGYTQLYSDLDSFIRAYYDLSQSEDWTTYVSYQVRADLRERLIICQAARQAGLAPDEATLSACQERLISEEVASYGYSRDKYKTDEEYEQALASLREEILDAYGEDYFRENAFVECAYDALVTLPTVVNERDIVPT